MAYPVLKEKKNEFVLLLRHSDAKACENEMVEITKFVGYVMTKESMNKTAQSDYDGLKQFNLAESIK
jgi:hypothetical protein